MRVDELVVEAIPWAERDVVGVAIALQRLALKKAPASQQAEARIAASRVRT